MQNRTNCHNINDHKSVSFSISDHENSAAEQKSNCQSLTPPQEGELSTTGDGDSGYVDTKLKIINDPIKLSNNIREFTTYRCEDCNMTYPYRQMQQHLMKQHSLTLTDYKLRYGKLEFAQKTFHRCRLCDKTVLFTQDSIIEHLKKKHTKDGHYLTFKEYAFAYLVRQQDVAKKTVTADMKRHVETITHRKSEAKLLKENKNLKKKQKLTTSDANITDTSYNADDAQFSDRVNDYSTYRCDVCNHVDSYRDIIRHIKTNHFNSLSEYKLFYGGLKFAKKMVHKCKLCGDVLNFTRAILVQHLKEEHQLESDFNTYGRQYLDGWHTDSLSSMVSQQQNDSEGDDNNQGCGSENLISDPDSDLDPQK